MPTALGKCAEDSARYKSDRARLIRYDLPSTTGCKGPIRPHYLPVDLHRHLRR
jgi:hypothetical protein